MKVLVIVTSAFGFDGISNVVRNYYIHQDHSSISTDVVTINDVDDDFKKKLDENDSRNYIISYRNKHPLKYILKLKNIIKANKYNIIHVHGNSATMLIEMIAGRLAQCSVRIIHNHTTQSNYPNLNKILRPFLFLTYTCALSCSKKAGEWLFGKRAFTIIENGIDINKFAFDKEARTKIRLDLNIENKLVVGHVGRFSQEKNHERIIEIFKELKKMHPEAFLILIGEGDLKCRIMEISSDFKSDILFVGNSTEVHKWLQAIDVILFPSFYEGLPLFLVEAQSAGLPCIISDVISQQINITNLVEHVSLNASDTDWSTLILQKKDHISLREKSIEKTKLDISNAGYNIVENANKLKELYIKVTTQHPSNSSKLFIHNTFPSKYLDYFLCISLIISTFTV